MSLYPEHKIMFLQTSSLIGGAERVFLDFFETLPVEVHKNSIVALPEMGPLFEHLQIHYPNVELYNYEMPKALTRSSRKTPAQALLRLMTALPALCRLISKLRSIVKHRHIKTLYAQGLKAQVLSLPVAHRLSTHLVWHTHDFFPKLKFVEVFLSLWQEPDLSISISKAVEAEVQKAIPSKWKTAHHVIYNSVDVDKFRYSPRSTLSTPPRIVMVGMLTPWKGQHLLLEAVRILQQKDVKVEVDLVGDQIYKTHGELGYRQELESLATKLGVRDQVHFHGLQADVRSFFSNADIAVHATTSPEPFGKVIVEAMAAGVPVIASAGGGVLEIVHAEENGLLFEMNNVEELAQNIQNLLDNHELRERVQKKARHSVEQNFNRSRFSSEMQKLLLSATHVQPD